jgi:two-component system osmolarity sensor histidine kinase EnvZ
LVFTLSVVVVRGWFVVFPVGKRSADDFAALMVLAARTRVELPPEAESDFRQELLQQHGLILGDEHQLLPIDPSLHPYLRFFEAALQRRTGQDVEVMHSDDGMMWVDVPVPNGKVRLGFSQERVGARPILMIAFILLTGTLVTLVAAVLLARLVVRPLATVAYAVGEVGGGRTPPPLPETGPREIAVLARTINRMSVQVRELLANRTVLLSGISHDLRTPLTRLRLALEMLEDNPDPDLLAGMAHDLEAMDTLIGQFLELAHGLDQEPEAGGESIDLSDLLESLVADARRGGAEIRLEAAACQVLGDPLSLKRIVANLLENAIRYGNGQPVDVRVICRPDATIVQVCDRGPGIPEAEREAVFRPFHRLEAARSRETGGSGLGLAIARQLADGQGWRLGLSAREGGGTVAQLSLSASA